MKISHKIFIPALVIGTGVFLAGCTAQNTQGGATASPSPMAQAQPTTAPQTTGSAMRTVVSPMAQQNILQTAEAAGNFTTLLAAVKAAGLESTLNGAGPFTVFAPTDEAFKKLPAGTVEALLKDKAQLTKILTYHVLPAKVDAKAASQVTTAKTVQGGSLTIKPSGSTLMIDNATVVTADIMTSNGVIHVIDTVLMPK
jgi:uncharacterized surface protein with fasciclin (FAS1) repeats